jgi:hydrogenase small subunit
MLIVHYLTFKRWPALDPPTPLFAYGKAIHDNCERRAHCDAGPKHGSLATRVIARHCPPKMGCKGPVSFQNCPNVRWNGGTGPSAAPPVHRCAEPPSGTA